MAVVFTHPYSNFIGHGLECLGAQCFAAGRSAALRDRARQRAAEENADFEDRIASSSHSADFGVAFQVEYFDSACRTLASRLQHSETLARTCLCTLNSAQETNNLASPLSSIHRCLFPCSLGSGDTRVGISMSYCP